MEENKSLCEYCGLIAVNDRTLEISDCPRHPEGPKKGKHKPYKGKPPYRCVFCKTDFLTKTAIHAMLGLPCAKNRTGFNEGNHTLSPEGLKTR